MATAQYKIIAIKGDNDVGIGIEKLNDKMDVIAFVSIYVNEPISYRDGYSRGVKYIASVEDKNTRLLISIPKQICRSDTFKMLRRQAPLREIVFRALPKRLNLTTPLLAHDAINRKTTIKEAL